MYLTEVCIAISKNEIDNTWYLDDERFGQGSYGCAFKEKYPPKTVVYPEAVNNVQVFQKLPISPD